ncbi:MAG: hypothetical protein RBU37_04640 [Myxococcota bacterium]|nr:hypothetical protein [Myxococcota bacterium]
MNASNSERRTRIRARIRRISCSREVGHAAGLIALVLLCAACGYRPMDASPQTLRYRIEAPAWLAWTRLELEQCLRQEGARLGQTWRYDEVFAEVLIRFVDCEQSSHAVAVDSEERGLQRISTKQRCQAELSSAESGVLLEGSTTFREHELSLLSQAQADDARQAALRALCRRAILWTWQQHNSE